MITAKLLLVYLLHTAGSVGIDVDTTNIDVDQAYCLAENIYYESKGEDIQGQFAVASATLNRVNDSRFPKTVCDVVKQSATSKKSNKLVCAFSWYCENDKRGREIPVRNRDGSINQNVVDQFQVASIVAITMLGGEVQDNTHGATHFHNFHTCHPSWAGELRKTLRVGNHDFYKLPPPKDLIVQTVASQ